MPRGPPGPAGRPRSVLSSPSAKASSLPRSLWLDGGYHRTTDPIGLQVTCLDNSPFVVLCGTETFFEGEQGAISAFWAHLVNIQAKEITVVSTEMQSDRGSETGTHSWGVSA